MTFIKSNRNFNLYLRVLIAVLAVFLFVLVSQTSSAYALTTEKCSAKVNSDKGNIVMGGLETRVTWEGRADTSEEIESLTLTFPDGTTFGTDDARVTVLSGDDLMTRSNVKASFSKDGQSIQAKFNEKLPAGAYIRLEVYEVYFPGSGGDMQMSGKYITGSLQADINDIPVINTQGTSSAELLSNWLSEQAWVRAWNSNKFCKFFFDPTLIVTSFPVVFSGFLMALAIVALAFPIAIPIGFLLSLMRISKFRILRFIASIYVNIVRGTPLFLQIYIAFFGLPLAGVQIEAYPLGVCVLAMNSAAYLCEIFRAGIQSIPKGQFEAARSLGMNGSQTMLFVIIPQTILRVLPTMTSEFILLYKDTSLLAAVGVMEVVMYAKSIVASTGSITPYIVAACFYLVITLPLAKLVGWLEKKLSGNGSSRNGKKSKENNRVPLTTPDAMANL